MSSHLPIGREVENLTSYFASQSFNVSHEWLLGCIQYFRSENPNCSDTEMRDSVLRQWELSDLRDSSNGCLPGNLKSHKIITLRGKYVVQIESVLNIGASAYSQFQKTRKVDVGNVELTEKKSETWEPKASRMLKFSLCDGPNLVEAIEHHPLPLLNERITPGTKMVVMGPVDSRRGCLFLKSENCKIIGGEVDSLLISNHMENILRRALNLLENPNPYSNQSEESSVPPSTRSEISTQRSFASHVPSEVQPQRLETQTHVAVDTRSTLSNQAVNPVSRRREEEHCPEVEVNDLDISGWADDDLFVDDEAFLEIEERAISHQNTNTVSASVITGSESVKSVQTKRAGSISAATSENFIPPKVPKNSTNKSASSKAINSQNSFLASDDYVDSMLLDEWEGEINDEIAFDTVPNISSKTHITNASTNSVNSLTSKVSNVSSNKLLSNQHQNQPHVPRVQAFQKSVNAGLDETVQYRNPLSSPKGQANEKSKTTLIPPQSNHPFTSNASRNQQLFKKPGSLPQDQTLKINTFNRTKSTSTTAQSSSSTGSIKSFFKPSSSSSRNSKLLDLKSPMVSTNDQHSMQSNPSHKTKFDCKSSKFNTDKKDDLLHLNSKTSTITEPKDSLFPPETLEMEADWADAYLNSQNLSFSDKFSDFEKSKTTSTETLQQSFPSSSKGQSSSRDHSSFPGCRSSEFEVPDHKVSYGRKNAFKKSKTHLPAAFCGPSDDDNLDVTLVPIDETPVETSTFKDSPNASRTKLITQKVGSAVSLTDSTPAWACPIKSPEPFEYLLHILHSPTKPQGFHKVKGTIFSLLSQLAVDAETGWMLSAKICDGTATLDVRFSSDVLEEIIGLSHKEFKQMKREASRNPLVKEKLVKVLKSSQQKLIDLNCIFTIKFHEDKMADVVKISEFTELEAHKLELRLLNK